MCYFLPEPVFRSIFEGLLVLTDIPKTLLYSYSVSVKDQPSEGQSTVRDTGSKLGHRPTNRNSMTQKLSSLMIGIRNGNLDQCVSDLTADVM